MSELNTSTGALVTPASLEWHQAKADHFRTVAAKMSALAEAATGAFASVYRNSVEDALASAEYHEAESLKIEAGTDTLAPRRLLGAY